MSTPLCQSLSMADQIGAVDVMQEDGLISGDAW